MIGIKGGEEGIPGLMQVAGAVEKPEIRARQPPKLASITASLNRVGVLCMFMVLFYYRRIIPIDVTYARSSRFCAVHSAPH